MNKSLMTKAMILMFLGGAFSSVLGVFRETITAYYYGAGRDLDSLLLAQTIPNMLTSFLYVFLSAIFLPLFIEKKFDNKRKKDWEFFNHFLIGFLLIGIVICIISWLLMPQVVRVFAKDGESQNLICNLSYVYFLGGILFGISVLISKVLNVYDHFKIPAFLPVINNMTLILFVVIFHDKIGIYSLAIGYVLGLLLQVLIQIPILKQKGYILKFEEEFIAHEFRKLFLISIPIFGMSLLEQTMNFTSRFFASQLEEGSISALNYANRLIMLVVTLLGTSIIDTIYPTLSKLNTENNPGNVDKLISETIKNILLLVAPCMFLLIFFSEDIVKILFQRGAFNSNDTKMTAQALIILAIGLFFIIVKDLLNKFLFTQKKYKKSLMASSIVLVTFMITTFLLIDSIGYLALAVASTISIISAVIYLISNYYRDQKSTKNQIKLSFLLKVVVIAFVATYIPYCISKTFDLNFSGSLLMTIINTIKLSIIGMVAMSLYVSLLKIVNVQEIDGILAILKTKFFKRKNI